MGRYFVLALGAAAVLGIGVYLFLEVRAPASPPTVTAPAPRAASPGVPQPAAQPEAAPPQVAQPAGSAAPAPIDAPAEPPPAFGMTDRELEVGMANANRAYDHGDYDEARQLAGQVLLRQPSNARMLRIMVSSLCIEGDANAAQASMAQLPAADQEQMKVRCQRYGINLTVSAGQ